MNWLFYVVIAFIFLLGVYGYCRGLLRMVYSVAAFLIAVAAMLFLAPILGSVLKNCDPIMENIQAPIKQVVGEKLDEGFDVEEVLKEYYHLPQKVAEGVESLLSDSTEEAKVSVSESISRCFAEYICEILAYIIVFLAVRIILVIVGQLLHIVEKLPVVSTMNHMGGTLLGLVEAIGLVWIFFMVLDLFHSTVTGRELFLMIWDNDFLRGLYQNNLFMKFLG